MAQTPVYIEDALSAVVADVATTLGYSIHYTYGPVAELVEKMQAMAKNQGSVARYPLVALITDVPEDMGDSTAIYSTCTVNIIIANFTGQKLLAEQRLAQNFKLVLMPIYEQFKTSLKKLHAFDVADEREIKHRIYKRYNFGRSQFFSTGIGVDFIDAIEIENMILPLKAYNCNVLKHTH